MKKRILPLLLAMLLLTGCASLLERSYSSVEPYTDRYWDTDEEDTLRAESYQDLVNSLLMLIEQRADSGTIRYYIQNEENIYTLARNALQEVRTETIPGSYLIQQVTSICEEGEVFWALTYEFSYREGVEDPESLMTLSDTQSLVDLLRLAVREEHQRLTARLVYDTPRADVHTAVESLWQELYRDGLAQQAPPEENPASPAGDAQPPAEDVPEEELPAEEEDAPSEEPEIIYPPCPWKIRFYPNLDTAGIVEIALK